MLTLKLFIPTPPPPHLVNCGKTVPVKCIVFLFLFHPELEIFTLNLTTKIKLKVKSLIDCRLSIRDLPLETPLATPYFPLPLSPKTPDTQT